MVYETCDMTRVQGIRVTDKVSRICEFSIRTQIGFWDFVPLPSFSESSSINLMICPVFTLKLGMSWEKTNFT